MRKRAPFNPFANVDSDDDLQQGDILRAEFDDESTSQVGMVLTADCDIAQDKAGEELTILEIVSAEAYIRETWAAREAERLYKRQLHLALPPLNSAISKQDSSLSVLTASALKDWLGASSPDQIIAAVGLPKKSAGDVARCLECSATYLRSGALIEPLTALKQMWSALQTNPKQIKARLSDALDPTRGAADIYFLPYIPSLAEVGYVVRLRSFAAVARGAIYRSRTDARISGDARAFYRIARLRDGLRFSVVQKVAILFSRIGLAEDFEDESSLASEMIIDFIHGEVCGGQS